MFRPETRNICVIEADLDFLCHARESDQFIFEFCELSSIVAFNYPPPRMEYLFLLLLKDLSEFTLLVLGSPGRLPSSSDSVVVTLLMDVQVAKDNNPASNIYPDQDAVGSRDFISYPPTIYGIVGLV